MITVADLCPYWTWLPAGGGPLRVYNLNRVVARAVRVLQFSVRPTLGHRRGTWPDLIRSHHREITDRYSEHQYFHPLITITSYLLYRLGLHSDLLMSDVVEWLSPRPMRRIVAQSSIVQVEHPWLYPAAADVAEGRPVVLVAHNVEAALWQLPARKSRSPLVKLARRSSRLEGKAVRCADAIVATSQADAEVFVNLYGAEPRRIHVIPNGVDLGIRRPATAAERSEARKKLGLNDGPVLLFIGSDHYPNKEALCHLQHIGQSLADESGAQFLIVGDVGRGMSSTPHMRITGFVEDVREYLAAADIALNPLTRGSGTSLKAVEYLACGLPTITTPTGMRGLDLTPERDVLCGEIAEFRGLILRALSDRSLRARLARNGRRTAERLYGWERLGQRMLDVYGMVFQ